MPIFRAVERTNEWLLTFILRCVHEHVQAMEELVAEIVEDMEEVAEVEMMAVRRLGVSIDLLIADFDL